jgi:hypothetical protein
MKKHPDIPSTAELETALGKTYAVWQKLIADLAQDFGGLREEWKPSKLPFGQCCLLKQKDRTLLYLLPGASAFEISIVLGERAVAIALASDLSAGTKKMIAEARRYAEGRGIRFAVKSKAQIAEIRKLVVIKTTPK